MLDVLKTVEYDRETGWNRRVDVLRVGLLAIFAAVIGRVTRNLFVLFCRRIISGTG